MTRRKLYGGKSYIPVIDLFAGPGGLGEGFSRAGEGRLFRTVLSIEKDAHAHSTLKLRALQRLLGEDSRVPQGLDQYLRGEIPQKVFWGGVAAEFPQEVQRAACEARCLELGQDDTEIRKAITAALGDAVETGKWVLIGGPPCQAYSLAGRARHSRAVRNLLRDPTEDERNYLYQKYLEIIARYKPAVFVMENVKGLLSANVGGVQMFKKILDDLAEPVLDKRRIEGLEYELFPLDGSGCIGRDDADQSSFIVKCEEHGAPQRRHRLIIVGVRKGFERKGGGPRLPREKAPTCSDVLSDLPPIRSRISEGGDSPEEWVSALRNADWRGLLGIGAKGPVPLRWQPFEGRLRDALRDLESRAAADFGSGCKRRFGKTAPRALSDWYGTRTTGFVYNHESRSHMVPDLHRYMFAAVFAEMNKTSPTLAEFPENLRPNHRNAAESAANRNLFADRFRVQLRDRPATTITSHISKDGHGFIHYDPLQCRSFTVREAARLQTFPDDYCFLGPRTAQFHQVGNAVPPYVAYGIAEAVAEFMNMM